MRNRALIYAASLAASYAIAGGIYIVSSSQIAGAVAHSVGEMQNLETCKGLGFIAITAVVIFLLSHYLFRRLSRQIEENIEQHRALLQTERQAMAGLFSSYIAHDCNNMLAVVIPSLQMLKAEPLSETGRQNLEDVENAVDRISVMMKQLRDVGKDHLEEETQKVDLVELVEDAAELLRHHSTIKRCRLNIEAGGEIVLAIYPEAFEQAITNLVLNAAEATGPGGRIDVRLFDGDGGAVVEVHDDGPGIPPEKREVVFKPFFTSRQEGTGLGMLSVKNCADAHEGRVVIDDSPLGGACVRMRLAPPEDTTSSTT